MIRHFRDRETSKLWSAQFSRTLRHIERAARLKLELLNAATSLADLKLPGLRLEALKGDRTGRHSIRVNDQYRICFEWRDGDAWNVEIVDYH